VQRWTPVSVSAMGGLLALAAILAAAPAVIGADYVDKLTTLYIYVILGAMWNALAGYAGLVSVGQQAFFGLGAYFAIRLSYYGVAVYPALALGAVGAGCVAWPVSWLMLRLRGGEFAIGMWVVAEVCHLLVNLDGLIQGETGTSLIALDALAPDARRADNYWLALGAMVLFLGLLFILLRSRLGASVQAIRDDEEAAASIGVKVLAAKRIIFLLAALGCGAAGAIFLATSITFEPRAYFSVQWSAYMIFMALVGGLGTFEGGIIGAVLFFLVQNEFGEIGVWYLVGLGAIAIVFALFLPRGLWGTIEDRFGLRLMPVGYRLRLDPVAAAPPLGRDPGSA
jgi:branched-chain amino acid transport system permease protein